MRCAVIAGMIWTMSNPLLGQAPRQEPTEVRIRDQVLKVWPDDDLARRGFSRPPVKHEDNAYWLYVEAINAFDEVPPALAYAFDYAYSKQWPDGADELAEFLQSEGNVKAFELIRKATQMPAYRPVYYGEPNQSLIGIILPNLSHQRMLSKLLVAEANRKLHEDDVDGAIADYLTVARMGAQVGDGITLIENLVGVAVWGLSQNALKNVTMCHVLTVKQLGDLEKQLAALADKVPSAQRGMEGERGFGIGLVDEITARPLQLPAGLAAISSYGGTEYSGVPTDGWGRLEQRLGQILIPDRTMKQHMNEFYDLASKRARGGAVSHQRFVQEEERIISSIPQWNVIARAMLPSISRAALLADRAKVDLALLRGAVAVRRYADRNEDQWPEDLEDLEAFVPDGALNDAMGDGPIRYRRTDVGWLLYSVSANGRDDGGKAGERWDELDMVIEFPPAPVEPFVAQE